MEKLKNKSAVFYVLSIVFEVSPLYATLISVQGSIIALIPALQVLITTRFINTVLEIVNKDLSVEAVYLPLAGIIITLAYSKLADKLLYFARIKFKNLLRSEFVVALVEKYGKLAYKHLEDPESVDLIERVLKEPEQKILATYNNLVEFASLVLTVVGIMSILLTKVWWTGILIIVCSVPLFKLAIKSGQANYEANRETTKYIRKYEYLGEILTTRDNIEERSVFDYAKELNQRWEENFEQAREKIFSTELKWFIRLKGSAVITSVISLLVVFALLPSVLAETISVGMFISLVNATFNLIRRMSRELTELMDELAENMEFIKDLKEFRELEEVAGVLTKPAEEQKEIESIEFKNVSYKYPNTDTYILKDLSFTIEQGKHYAIVGLNGSGKTTIIKLLTGLYRDFEGNILINGRSISDYSQQDLKAFYAVAYQNFMKYSISLKENVAVGDINNLKNNDDKIVNALQTMGIDNLAAELPVGLDTPLGKIRTGGVDLSGGQWQKVALARFIVNPAPLKILDEPTAAIDPVSESQIYERFDQLCKGQTTIFISHRLGSTSLADQIYVIDDGRLIEQGSHEELMAENSAYAELYESQRSWYQ